jgi:hypothetical protein
VSETIEKNKSNPLVALGLAFCEGYHDEVRDIETKTVSCRVCAFKRPMTPKEVQQYAAEAEREKATRSFEAKVAGLHKGIREACRTVGVTDEHLMTRYYSIKRMQKHHSSWRYEDTDIAIIRVEGWTRSRWFGGRYQRDKMIEPRTFRSDRKKGVNFLEIATAIKYVIDAIANDQAKESAKEAEKRTTQEAADTLRKTFRLEDHVRLNPQSSGTGLYLTITAPDAVAMFTLLQNMAQNGGLGVHVIEKDK